MLFTVFKQDVFKDLSTLCILHISSTYGTPRRSGDIDVFHSVHPLLRFQVLNKSISINVFSFFFSFLNIVYICPHTKL